MLNPEKNHNDKPFIPPEVSLPEITVKAFILGIVLSAILASANAYLGLFAGMTVSASIPAAVISMAVLRFFRNANILENNIVQTAASAGESLAAGVIFTFPALVLMGYWHEFNYWETSLVALCGGVLGVLFTIPLRKALIVDKGLLFPEGVATAEVLKTGEEGGASVKYLAGGAIAGALLKLASEGFRLWQGILDKATIAGGKLYLYFGINLSPALVAVGYIVGLRIAVLVFLGGVISWWIAIPIYLYWHGIPSGQNPVDIGYQVWDSKIRYLGAGAMLTGGVWALISIARPVIQAFKTAFRSLRSGIGHFAHQARTELDTPLPWVIIGISAMVIPVFIIYLREIHDVTLSVVMAVLMILAGFLFSAVAGYMAGLVGSSNNPISGVTIATILTSSLILLALAGTGSGSGPAAAIMIGAVVCCAAAIAGDNMQDLKAGHVLGATPYKQQIMQMTGVVAAAFCLAPVLNGLHASKTIGSRELAAPQATLMKSIAEGIFQGNLPWEMIGGGILLGILIIIIDLLLKYRHASFRIPVLAVAVGVYLPFELDSAIMAGGLASWILNRLIIKYRNASGFKEARFTGKQAGMLMASGLITGEALLGILLAMLVVVTGQKDLLTLTAEPFTIWSGVGLLLALIAGMIYIAYRAFLNALKN